MLANTVGYAPHGHAGVLTMLIERNKTAADRNGLFASHPEMKDRLANIAEGDQGQETRGGGDGSAALRAEHHL